MRAVGIGRHYGRFRDEIRKLLIAMLGPKHIGELWRILILTTVEWFDD
jgi:hypothetical protein